MADLTTSADLKLYLGIEHEDDDTLLASLITQVSEAIRSYTDRIFTEDSSDRVEHHDGGVKELIVRYPPIKSITSIIDTFNNDEVIDSGDYNHDPEAGLIYISQDATAVLSSLGELQKWGAGRRRWKITYKGGSYSAVPDDVVLACHVWIADIYANRDDVKSGRLGDQQWQRADGMPERVRTLLAKYVLIAF